MRYIALFAFLATVAAVIISCSTKTDRDVLTKADSQTSAPYIAGCGSVTYPKLLARPEIHYSDRVREALYGWSENAYVILKILVKSDGSVGKVDVLRIEPLNNPVRDAFANDITEHVKKCRFLPAKINGTTPVDAIMMIKVDWPGKWKVITSIGEHTPKN